jgi:hypothetical protein
MPVVLPKAFAARMGQPRTRAKKGATLRVGVSVYVGGRRRKGKGEDIPSCCAADVLGVCGPGYGVRGHGYGSASEGVRLGEGAGGGTEEGHAGCGGGHVDCCWFWFWFCGDECRDELEMLRIVVVGVEERINLKCFD